MGGFTAPPLCSAAQQLLLVWGSRSPKAGTLGCSDDIAKNRHLHDSHQHPSLVKDLREHHCLYHLARLAQKAFLIQNPYCLDSGEILHS